MAKNVGPRVPKGGAPVSGGFATEGTEAEINQLESKHGAVVGITTEEVVFADGSIYIILPGGGLKQIAGIGGDRLENAEEGLPSVEQLMSSFGYTRDQAEALRFRMIGRANNVTAGALDDIQAAATSGSLRSGGKFDAAAANAAAERLFFEGTQFPESIRQFDVVAAENERASRASENISGFQAQTTLGLGLGNIALNEAELRRRILSNPSDALARIFALSNQVSPFGRVTAADQLNAMGTALATALAHIPGGPEAVFNGVPVEEVLADAGVDTAEVVSKAVPTRSPVPGDGGGGGGFPGGATVTAPGGLPLDDSEFDLGLVGDEFGGFAPATQLPLDDSEFDLGFVGGELNQAPIGSSSFDVQQPVVTPAPATLLGPRENLNARGITDIIGAIASPLVEAVKAIPEVPSEVRARERQEAAELESLTQISGLTEEEMGFASGGFTREKVFEVGEDPRGGDSGFEEIILNPEEAAIAMISAWDSPALR